MAPTNETALRANAEPPHNTPDRSSEMLLQNEQGSQARLAAFRYARGNVTAVVELTHGTTARAVTFAIGGVSEQQAAGMIQANARLMLGAIVMDGESFRAIQDNLAHAIGSMSFLAPQEEDATQALASLEQAKYRLSECVS